MWAGLVPFVVCPQGYGCVLVTFVVVHKAVGVAGARSHGRGIACLQKIPMEDRETPPRKKILLQPTLFGTIVKPRSAFGTNRQDTDYSR